MIKDIFVAVLCVFSLGVGVWTWWYENYYPEDAQEKKRGGEAEGTNE